MAETDDTSPASPGKRKQVLAELVEPQRAKLRHAHAIMICLREVLMYTEDDGVIYAEAANAAATLTNDAVAELDSVRLLAVFAAPN